jgi:hypothetical protein
MRHVKLLRFLASQIHDSAEKSRVFLWSIFLLISTFIAFFYQHKSQLSAQFSARNSLQTAEFEWQALSTLTPSASTSWRSNAQGQLFFVQKNSQLIASPLKWTGQIQTTENKPLFTFVGAHLDAMESLKHFGFSKFDHPENTALVATALPQTLNTFASSGLSGANLGAHLLASVEHRALWAMANIVEGKSPDSQTFQFVDTKVQGIERSLSCSQLQKKRTNLKIDIKLTCTETGYALRNTVKTELYQSVETLTLKSTPDFSLSEVALKRLHEFIEEQSQVRQISNDARIVTSNDKTSRNLGDLELVTSKSKVLEDLKMIGTGSTEGEKTALYLRAKELLASSKTFPQEWAQALLSAEAGDETLQILGGAMASSGSEQAQQNLLHLLEQSGESVKAEQIAGVLGFAQNFSQASFQTLLDFAGKQKSSGVKNQALISIGILANSQKNLDEVEKKRVEKFLIDSLNTENTNELIAALAALGNAAFAESWPYISKFTTFSDPNVRKQAFLSLRNAPWTVVQASFKHGLLDINDGVVMAALNTLETIAQPSHKNISELMIDSLIQWNLNHHGEDTWKLGLKVLALHGKQLPEVRRILTEFSTTLRSPVLRQTALDLMRS